MQIWTYLSNLHSSFNIRVNRCQFASDFSDEKDANHHESRIVWPHPEVY